MKTLLTLAFAVLAFIPQTFAMDNHEMAEKADPAVKAVVFYAVNCGSCKILEPRIEEAMKAINMNTVDVIKFDFSNKEAIESTKQLAASKNVEAVLNQYGAKTGFVVLIDQNGNEINKLKVDDDTAEIASKIVKAVVEAS